MGTQGNTQELNKRHQAFAELVADGATATDAYLAASYSAEKRGTLHRNASRLRRDPKIQTHIRALRQEAELIAREDTILSISRNTGALGALGIACSEGTALEGETSGRERGNPHSAIELRSPVLPLPRPRLPRTLRPQSPHHPINHCA